MRTSKEELIQRGILMPGEAAQASPFLSSSVLLEAASRSSTPRLNLPQLAASSHSTGRSHFFSIECVIVLCPVLKLGPPSNINNETEGPNSSHNGRGTRDPDHRFLNIIEIAGCHRPSPILSWPKS